MEWSVNESGVLIDVAAQPAQLCVLRAAVSTWCRSAGASAREAHQISRAVDEADAKLNRHGYTDGSGRIRLKAWRASGRVCVVLEDDAPQVPLDEIAPRPLSDVRPGGLGVHFIRTTMEEATWSHRPEGGMQLTMSLPLASLVGPSGAGADAAQEAQCDD